MLILIKLKIYLNMGELQLKEFMPKHSCYTQLTLSMADHSRELSAY